MGYGAAIAVVLFLIMLVLHRLLPVVDVPRREGGAADVSRPLDRSSAARAVVRRSAIKSLLPLALLLWLLPLIAVAIFSVKPDADFTQGNYWGLPSSFEGATITGRCSSTPTCRATC